MVTLGLLAQGRLWAPRRCRKQAARFVGWASAHLRTLVPPAGGLKPTLQESGTCRRTGPGVSDASWGRCGDDAVSLVDSSLRPDPRRQVWRDLLGKEAVRVRLRSPHLDDSPLTVGAVRAVQHEALGTPDRLGERPQH